MPELDERGRLQKKLSRAMARAIQDFHMIEDGDRILCAVSGGKDSYTLHHLLMSLRERAPVRFEVVAVNIDQGHPGYPGHLLTEFMASRGHDFRMVAEDTYSIVTDKIPSGKTYCSLCSRLRRGILYRLAQEMGCTKIALGHHREDAIATLMLNLVFAGQLKAMPPKLLADDGKNVVVRPLIFCAEDDIARFAALEGFPILPCDLCGSQDGLERRAIAKLLADLDARHPGARANMLAALGNVRPSHLLDAGLWKRLGLEVADDERERALVHHQTGVAAPLRGLTVAIDETSPADPPDALSAALAVATSPILLTGVYAWSVTVAPSFNLAFSQITQTGPSPRPLVAMIASVLALGPLLVGVVLERRRVPSAPWTGVWGFFALCLTTWLALPAAVDVARVDGLRGALGGAGFALFALAWGVPDVFRRVAPEEDPRADTSMALDARDRLPRAVLLLAAVGIVAAAALSFFAWQVHDVPRGLLAHSLAGLCAVALVSGSAQVAVGRRGYSAASPRTRLRRARAAVVLLAASALLGLAYALLSR